MTVIRTVAMMLAAAGLGYMYVTTAYSFAQEQLAFVFDAGGNGFASYLDVVTSTQFERLVEEAWYLALLQTVALILAPSAWWITAVPGIAVTFVPIVGTIIVLLLSIFGAVMLFSPALHVLIGVIALLAAACIAAGWAGFIIDEHMSGA